MPEVICDVSPIREGTLRGVDLPAFESLDWMRIRQHTGQLLLPMITDLGAGEREVLAFSLRWRLFSTAFGSCDSEWISTTRQAVLKLAGEA